MVGGMIASHVIMWIVVVIVGFTISFLAFNSETDYTEITNLTNKRDYESSFDIKLDIYYTTLYKIFPEKYIIGEDEDDEPQLFDLCSPRHLFVDFSEYFLYNQEIDDDMICSNEIIDYDG